MGADFDTGTFTHSVRFEYLKFENQIVDETHGSNLPLANLGLELFMNGPGLATGANFLAPQTTSQSNHQLKYDGTKTVHSHIVRYGVALNHIQGFTYEAVLALSPLRARMSRPLKSPSLPTLAGLASPASLAAFRIR
jgi:hypothetical protein